MFITIELIKASDRLSDLVEGLPGGKLKTLHQALNLSSGLKHSSKGYDAMAQVNDL